MTDTVLPIDLPLTEIAELCRRYHVRELSLFGSALRDDFRADSDVDVLVLFQPDAKVSFITLGKMEQELEALFGRKVDLVPKDGLKPLIRDEVIRSSRVLYAED